MLKYIALEIKTNKISFINIAHNIINHLPFVQNETRVLFHVYNYTQTSTIIVLSTVLDIPYATHQVNILSFINLKSLHVL